MKTNVTVSLDSDLVARLDHFRAPKGFGRSGALELLLEQLPVPGEVEAVILEAEVEYFEGEPRTDLALRGDGEVVAIEPEPKDDPIPVSVSKKPKKP